MDGMTLIITRRERDRRGTKFLILLICCLLQTFVILLQQLTINNYKRALSRAVDLVEGFNRRIPGTNQ